MTMLSLKNSPSLSNYSFQLTDYFELFNQMADPVMLIKDDHFISCNEASLKLLGYPNKASFNSQPTWVISPKFQACGLNSEEKSLAMNMLALQHGHHRFNWQYLRYNGEIITVKVTLTAIIVMNEVFLHVVWREKIDKAWLKKQLKEASVLKDAIFNSRNYASIATDVHGVIQIFNVGAETMLGFDATEMMNIMTLADLSDADVLSSRAECLSLEFGVTIKPDFEALVYKAALGLEDSYELTYICKDGSRLPALVSVTAIRNKEQIIIGYLLIATDNTARKLAEKESRIASAAFKSAQSMYVTDHEGYFLHINQAFTDITGYNMEELVGKKTNILRSELHDATFYNSKWQTLLDNGQWSGEIWSKRKNGELHLELVNIIGVTDEKNCVSHYVVNCTDIGKLKAYELGLLEAKAKTEHFSTLKTEFIASMSHEIRTPMSAIIGFSGLALYEDMSDDIRTYMQDINTASTSLLGILQDILDFSKLEVGRVVIEAQPFNLKDTLNTINALFMGAAQQKGLNFSISLENTIANELIGDKNRLQQVLINLVGNAIKFTQQGSVKLNITLQHIGLTQVRVLFAITDTGIGISHNDQDKLFKAFSQVDGSFNRQFGGTGLGLAISKNLVELMSGEISIISSKDLGSTFSFVLAFDSVKTAIKHMTHTTPRLKTIPHKNKLKGSHILVVEDNVMAQTLIKKLLGQLGADLQIAQDAEAALAMLEHYDFDAVLMDIHMPVIDGIQLTKLIHQQKKFAKLPIIALSAGVTESERNNCIAIGMVGFIAKPINVDQLYSVLKLWLADSHTSDSNISICS